MTQMSKRILKIVAITVLAIVVVSLFFYGGVKLILGTYERKMTKFEDRFVTVCEENGLDLSEAEFCSGTYRYALRDSTYLVSFRVLSEKEDLLFLEYTPNRREISESEKQNLPDDGVEYVWRTDMTGSWFVWLYRSEAAADGYVYCFVECSYY